jgi:hypothetical protein
VSATCSASSRSSRAISATRRRRTDPCPTHSLVLGKRAEARGWGENSSPSWKLRLDFGKCGPLTRDSTCSPFRQLLAKTAMSRSLPDSPKVTWLTAARARVVGFWPAWVMCRSTFCKRG